MSSGDPSQAVDLKNKGNEALNKGQIEDAIKFYNQAIELDPTNHVLYSNRSAAYCKSDNFEGALADAQKCIDLKADWGKGYSRKGAALMYLKKTNDAISAYEAGLAVEPKNPQLKSALEDAKKSTQPRNSFFSEASMLKLYTDPRTKDFFNDPSYLEWLKQVQNDPAKLYQSMQDPRALTTFNVLLGMDADFRAGEAYSPRKEEKKDPSPPPKNQPEPMDTTPDPKFDAIKEKEQGNAFYKEKNFEKALEHYGKAIELDPINITYYNNRAAVYFEQKNYEECIKECEQSIEIGRENRADFKLIAKGYGRMGASYLKLKNLKEALKYYQKSLTEHRLDENVKKLNEIEKLIKEEESKAYINPELAIEEKEKGNEFFKQGNYPQAMKHYSEAIKRNPKDAKLYSNRAACYQKLAEFQLALKDSEQCIELEPNFLKGHIRKGLALLAMRATSRASTAFQKALEIDPNNEEALDGYRKSMVAQNANPDEIRKEAMSDPEIQQILHDPAMRLILEQMQSDPKALGEHLKNPEIAAKIKKLMDSGLIAIR